MGRAAALVIVLAGAGCDKLFSINALAPDARSGGDGGHGDGGADGGPCVYFQDAVELQGPSGAISGADPTLSADLLDVVFVADSGNGNGYELWEAVRPTSTTAFGPPKLLASVNSTGEDSDPALSADGTILMFKSDRTGQFRAYESQRPDITGGFSTPAIPAGFASIDVYGLDLSPDGLTLYFDDGNTVTEIMRQTTAGDFMNGTTITNFRAQFPSVSPNGLELYFNGGGVLRRARASTSGMFAPNTEVEIDGQASDADLAADDKTLIEVTDRLVTRTRCP